jgi:hypothetical protein
MRPSARAAEEKKRLSISLMAAALPWAQAAHR